MADARHNDLFASLIFEIKSYSGKDPLMPWLTGIRKMRECLPPQMLKEKLPRFLQKCVQSFETDRRYRNDLRYLKVWLQLMDYAGNPKAILRTMEMKHIGLKKALFYQAYALYYEKMKKYDEAEKMFRVGVQNLAEPLDELHKSYEHFLQRMERHKRKKIQRQQWGDGKAKLVDTKVPSGSNISCGENTVIRKFADKAIVGKSEAENVCHHGLVEPTINMKEAMNSINDMFREPLDPFVNGRKPTKSRPNVEKCLNNGFEVFVDDSADNKDKAMHLSENPQPSPRPFEIYIDDSADNQDKFMHPSENPQPGPRPFEIYIDDEGSGDKENSAKLDAFQFPVVMNPPSDCAAKVNPANSSRRKFREDTVFNFVGSTIVDEPEGVENVCHHGLVEPTVNLKEAMDEINNMFGKPMDFVRSRRSRNKGKSVNKRENMSDTFSILPDDEPKDNSKGDCSGFLILPDDEPKPSNNQTNGNGFSILADDDLKSTETIPPAKQDKLSRDQELNEPTVFTREAIDEINKMFGMPLNF